jgi:cephalosporin hydroxylase
MNQDNNQPKSEQVALFAEERRQNIAKLGADKSLAVLARDFMIETGPAKYTYNFDWLGRPIIQFPQDIVAFQELVWRVQPDLIIETGVAHGGSLILSASMMALLDMTEGIRAGERIDPSASERKVVGIDIDIRSHNREAILSHPMSSRIELIQGSSIAPEVVQQVRAIAADYSKVMVCLDSNHTHEHVLEELKAYAPLVTASSYCIVWDTAIEDVPESLFADRPWGAGNSPKTAVREFLNSHPEFALDKSIQHKLLITVAPDGFLKRIA